MQNFFADPLTFHLAVAAVLVAALYLLSSAVRAFLNFLGRRIFRKTETELDDRILSVVLKSVRPLMLILGLQLGVREIRKGLTPADVTIEQLLQYADALLYILTALLVLRVVLGILREFVGWYLDRISADGASGLTTTIGPIVGKVINLLVGLVALIVILDHFGVNIGSLLVSLGVGSLAVALAAQDTLANMIGGFVILVDRPFRVGDRIEVGAGQVGDVLEIGLRSTKLVNFDNNVIVIPNAELVKGRITNFSRPFPPTRVLLRFEVAYGTDTEMVRALLLEIAARQPELLADPAPAVYLTALEQASVQLTFAGRARSWSEVWAVETRLREEAYRLFREQGIEAPLPHRIIHVHNGTQTPQP
jgi:small-conductance mechanosensitive channel